MMKSPTSLIRFRNAVGVMLALSALFAVVLSAVTITQDRAFAQDPPTVSISVDQTTADADNVVEEGNTVTITVTLSAAIEATGTALSIPVTVGADVDSADSDDYSTSPDPAAVEFPADGSTVTDTVDITITNDADVESVETLTVSLTPPDGYGAGDATSVMITITDGDNRDALGDVSITVLDDSDPPVAVAATGAKVDQVLTADVSGIEDLDYTDDTDTTDVDENQLNVILEGGGTEVISYQWIRINGTPDTAPLDQNDTADEMIGMDQATYTPVEDDVGKVLTVEVTWLDKYGNGDNMANPLDTGSQTLDETVYDEARPFIIKSAARLDPGVVLTRDTSGMFNDQDELIDDMGMLVDGDTTDDTDDPDNPVAPIPIPESAVTLTWQRNGMDFLCDADGDSTLDELDAEGNAGTDGVDDEVCEGTADSTNAQTYTLDKDDVAKSIRLVAKYSITTANDDSTTADVDEAMSDEVTLTSDPAGTVFSGNRATGIPTITGIAQVGATLTATKGSIEDDDGNPGEDDITYTWFHGSDDVDSDDQLGTGSTYTLKPTDVGNTIKVKASFNDGLGDPESVTSNATSTIAGSPGQISRIEPGIRGITVSASDNVMLSVDIYGLQNAKDNGLGGDFSWTQKSGDNVVDLDGSGREIDYTAPSSPGSYMITATLGGGECQPADEDDRDDACSATITVQVRRPSAAPDDGVAPQNPPGEIPTILTDGDGNQYEVFTPEGGGTFTGEGYSLSVGAGAIPNGEYIGVRVSDEGSASNAGMTHQRYTLGGNMYSVSAVDANNASITSYALNSAATVCVPLPDELSPNISSLALVAINADGSLTILSASVRLGTNGTQVCGNLSGLPASVAVGSQGAPAPPPTPVPPTATPEPPATGGAAPNSNSALWALLLGFAVVASGTFLVIGRRRDSAGK